VISTVGYDASGEEIVDLKAYDFDDELDQVFAQQPEAILLLNFDEVFQVTSRIASRGDLDSYTTPPLFFGSDANFTEDLLTNAAPEVLESMVGIAPLTDADSEGYQRFAALAEDAGVDLTESSAPARYDAAFLIALAMESAGSDAAGAMKVVLQQVSKDDPGDVTIFADDWAAAKEAIAAGQGLDYEGASGPIEFDDNGDITSGVYVVWKVMPSGAGAFAFDLDETVAYDAVGTFTRSGDGGASSDE
jgi:branched-chain amino acid transport system substrate-binding protein